MPSLKGKEYKRFEDIGHMVKEADKDRGSKGDLMKVVWMKFKEEDSKQREENEDWRVC
jgi:hypothetical protein